MENTSIPKDTKNVTLGACLAGYCVYFELYGSLFITIIPTVEYQCNIPLKQNLYIETFTINLN